MDSMYHRPMDRSLNVTAFILAGGKSTRMGTDKAFMEYQGHTLLARALDLGRSVASEVRIVGSQEKFAAFGSVVEDVFRDCGRLMRRLSFPAPAGAGSRCAPFTARSLPRWLSRLCVPDGTGSIHYSAWFEPELLRKASWSTPTSRPACSAT